MICTCINRQLSHINQHITDNTKAEGDASTKTTGDDFTGQEIQENWALKYKSNKNKCHSNPPNVSKDDETIYFNSEEEGNGHQEAEEDDDDIIILNENGDDTTILNEIGDNITNNTNGTKRKSKIGKYGNCNNGNNNEGDHVIYQKTYQPGIESNTNS